MSVHNKAEQPLPQNYRLIDINGCMYRLHANVVRGFLTLCALAETQIFDTQFKFYPRRSTNQPIYTRLKTKKLFTAFLDLTAAYDSVLR